MKNWIAIVNAHAGGAPEDQLARLLHHSQDCIGGVWRTQYLGHATALAREAREAGGVIAIGGDGTIGEVLQGLDLTRQTLAVIAAGRGNSLARDLGLYRHGGSVLGLRSQRIDLMRLVYQTSAGDRRELLAASNIAVGYPAAVARLANRTFRRAGSLCYAAAAMCSGPGKRRMRLTFDDHKPEEFDLTGVMVSNTRHAANFQVFPRAACTDASLDAVVLRAGRLGQGLHNLSLLTGVPFYGPPCRSALRRVAITMESPQLLLVDGELLSDVVSLEIEVRPAALACLMNASGA